MRVFISSVIRGMESLRSAAAEGVRTLGYEVLRAEDFPASPQTPRHACLEAVREADVVILILGASYGSRQESGLSATHEEYREVKGRQPVLVYVQQGIQHDEHQLEFVTEARDWAAGHYTSDFTDEASLKAEVIRSLHQHALAQATGSVDGDEMRTRAEAMLPEDHRREDGPRLHLSVAAAPLQAVLRPTQIESRQIEETLTRHALQGAGAIFTTSSGTRAMRRGRRLSLEQDAAGFALDEEGSMYFWSSLAGEELDDIGVFPVIIEERVQDLLDRGLNFMAWTLDQIDAGHRLTHVVPLALVTAGSGMIGWQTRREHERRRELHRAAQFGTPGNALLRPLTRTRGALRTQSSELAEDLTRLLGREWGRPAR